MSDADRLDALLPALRRREREAFVDLYDLMAGQLLTFAHGHLSDPHAAEDVVQDTFLALTRHIRRFRGDGRSLLAWLYTTARRGCIDRLRRRMRHEEAPLEAVGDREGYEAQPEDVLGDPQVRAGLEQLSESQRSAVVLRRVVGLSGEEVGGVLGLDREAVYALCSRGEAALRGILASDSGRSRRLER